MSEKHEMKLLAGVPQSEYGERYADHLLEIYKLYIEMADRISTKRQVANSFFVTINSGIIAFIGYVNSMLGVRKGTALFYISVAFSGMILSYLWYRLVLAYRQLNSAKFKVIHSIEAMLPIRPYATEWNLLEQGKNSTLYKPLTHIETVVPWVFFFLHTIILLVTIYIIVHYT